MAAFKDESGREWEVRIDAPSIMRIREECDPRFLLNDNEDSNTYERLQIDSCLLCRVIYILCAKQRSERGVSEESFYLDVIGNGDVIEAATEAMLAAIISFTPRLTRQWLQASVAKQKKIEKLGYEAALKRLNDPSLEQRAVEMMEQRMDVALATLTQPESATDSPVSPESAPPA